MNNTELLEIQNIELDLLLEAMKSRYGYDFCNYSRSHVKRRVLHRIAIDELENISELTKKVLYSKETFNNLLLDLSINVTEMFRYPLFFKHIREFVTPILKTYPSINIWHVGCSTGEEVLSMAILLEEEGLLHKCQLYATDMNKKVLEIAREGIYPVSEIKKWTSNYQEAGGEKSFSEYYTAKYDSVIFNQRLYEKIAFMEHNLTQDQEFIGAHLIVCRNVLIYFDKELKEHVLDLLQRSLIPGGVLGIGSKESIRFTKISDKFDVLSEKAKIYQKKVEFD